MPGAASRWASVAPGSRSDRAWSRTTSDMGREGAASSTAPAREPSRTPIRGARIAPRLWPARKTRLRVDPRRRAQELDGRERVVDHLLADRQVARSRELLLVDLRALVVTQHRDAARREALREVLERAESADRLVAILGARAVHEDDARKRPVARGHGKRPGKGHGARDDLHLPLAERALRHVGRRRSSRGATLRRPRETCPPAARRSGT